MTPTWPEASQPWTIAAAALQSRVLSALDPLAAEGALDPDAAVAAGPAAPLAAMGQVRACRR